MSMIAIAGAVAMLAGAPPSAIPAPTITPPPSDWPGPSKRWAAPAWGSYGARTLIGEAETPAGGGFRGRVKLADVGDAKFTCRGFYDTANFYRPKLRLKCSDGARVTIALSRPAQTRAYGEGTVGETPFRFGFGTEIARR